MNTAIIATATTSSVNVSSQSLADCIHQSSRFYDTLYVNICNGSSYSVPNGFWDYAACLFVGAIALFVVAIMIKKIVD